ncbi:MAG: hypothetical protein ABI851_12910 [Saprospiraceae bacterium]
MTMHNGIIELGSVENKGIQDDQIGLLHAQFVHYPNCQQLQVWLPESNFQKEDYGNYQIIIKATNKIEEQGKVQDKVSGSVQMLFDTLSLTEGDYTLEIEHPNGGKLCLHFHKCAEDIVLEATVPNQESNKEDSLWKVYKDGFGNVIPNEDKTIRQKADEKINTVFEKVFGNNKLSSPRLEYVDHGRSGKITYIENETRIDFYHELGGGGCKMYIDIPAEESWEKVTNTSLHKRREILLFIASSVIRDQAPSWRYEFQEKAILFY